MRLQCSTDKKVEFNGKYLPFLLKHLTHLPNFVCLMVILQAHSLVKLWVTKDHPLFALLRTIWCFFSERHGDKHCWSSWCSSHRKSRLVMLRPSKGWLLGHCTVSRGWSHNNMLQNPVYTVHTFHVAVVSTLQPLYCTSYFMKLMIATWYMLANLKSQHWWLVWIKKGIIIFC